MILNTIFYFIFFFLNVINFMKIVERIISDLISFYQWMSIFNKTVAIPSISECAYFQ